MDGDIECIICQKKFASQQSESRHRIAKHGIKKATTNNISCGEDNCEAKFKIMEDLRNHLQSSHAYTDVNNKEILTFKTEQGELNFLILYLSVYLRSIIIITNNSKHPRNLFQSNFLIIFHYLICLYKCMERKIMLFYKIEFAIFTRSSKFDLAIYISKPRVCL